MYRPRKEETKPNSAASSICSLSRLVTSPAVAAGVIKRATTSTTPTAWMEMTMATAVRASSRLWNSTTGKPAASAPRGSKEASTSWGKNNTKTTTSSRAKAAIRTISLAWMASTEPRSRLFRSPMKPGLVDRSTMPKAKTPVKRMARAVSFLTLETRVKTTTPREVTRAKNRALTWMLMPKSSPTAMPVKAVWAMASPMKARPLSTTKVPMAAATTATSPTPTKARTINPYCKGSSKSSRFMQHNLPTLTHFGKVPGEQLHHDLLRQNLSGGTHRQHPAVEGQNLIKALGQAVQVMGGGNDGLASFPQLHQKIRQLVLGLGIKARCGFVQEDQVCLLNQCPG